MAQEPLPPPPAGRPEIPDDPIARDTPCPACGYNLRGLRYSQRCPECGGPAAGAVAGLQLLYGDPAWVRRLARGARWLRAAFLPWAAAIVLGIEVLLTLRQPPDPFLSALLVLLVAASLAVTWPLWLLTSPNPATAERERWLSARVVARIALVVCLLGTMALVVVGFTRWPPIWGLIAALLLSPLGLSGPVLVVALSYYTEELGIWMADRRLGTRAAEFRTLFVMAWCGAAGAAGILYLGAVIPCVCLFIPAALGALLLATLILFLTAPIAGRLEDIAARARSLREADAPGAR